VRADPNASKRHHVDKIRPALEAAGTFEPATGYHIAWFTCILALLLGVYFTLLSQPSGLLRVLAIFGGGVAIMQIGLFSHEVGHGAVTTSRRGIWALGQLTSSFLIGFAFSHWRASHAVHHNHPQREDVDPDMESAGYALNESMARNSHGAGRWVARTQPVSVLLGFLAWGFAIRISALIHCIRHLDRRSALDIVLVTIHLFLWLGVPALLGFGLEGFVNFAFITSLNGIYMAMVLVVPHVGTGTIAADQEMSFFERQVRFSRNYNASWLGTLLCGGLNLQVEHHLLPHVPCVRLRRARPAILAYCQEHELPYRQTNYFSAWLEVLRFLHRMGRIAARNSRVQTLTLAAERGPNA
jgi:fatty acid desaturase